MEDATITNEKEQTNSSLISAEDLIMEIGKQHVDKMNSDKMMKLSLRGIKELKDSNTNLQINKDKTVNDFQTVEKSNELYRVNNQKLDKIIVTLKQEKTELSNELVNEKIKLKEKETQFLAYSNQNTIYELQIVNLTEQIKVLEEKSKKKKSNTKTKK